MGTGEALVMIAAGIGVSLIGRRYRGRYLREFSDELRASRDPVYAMSASLMLRGAAFFLTAGALLVIFGAYFAAVG